MVKKIELTLEEEARRWRLRIARHSAGWLTALDAGRHLEARGVVTERTYKGYEVGARPVTTENAVRIARAFRVDPPEWIRDGDGKPLEFLRRRAAELDAIAKRKVSEVRVPEHARAAEETAAKSINQLTSNIIKLDINPSQLLPTGRIPVLLAEEIASFLAGKRESLMSGPTLPVSEEFSGPDHFCYEIGPSDTSMVGMGKDSFPPRTALIINTNASAWKDETPPFYVLARTKGMKGWLFRSLESPLPLSVAKEYTLRALNPDIEPIRVTDPAKWEIAGRLVADQRRY